MHKDFDELLKAGLLVPPDDFTGRVMGRITALPLPAAAPRGGGKRVETLQWIAFIAAGLAGAAQLAVFTFGIWTATAAG